MSEQVADVLDNAADRIEKGGWWDGRAKTDVDPGLDGGACIANAINISPWENYEAAITAVASHVQVSGLDALFDWNDAPGRTEQEVLDALRAAAKVERMAP